jgi:hypothetical protein
MQLGSITGGLTNGISGAANGALGIVDPMVGLMSALLPFVLGIFITYGMLSGWYAEGIRIALAIFRKKTILTLYDGSGKEETWAADKTTADSIYFLHPKTKRNFKIDSSRYDKHGYTIIGGKTKRYHHFTWALPGDAEQIMRITQMVKGIRDDPAKYPFLSRFKYDDEITEAITTAPSQLEKMAKRWSRHYRTLKLARVQDGKELPIANLNNEFKLEIESAWTDMQKDFLVAGPVDWVGGLTLCATR